jgi:hypothetical protein
MSKVKEILRLHYELKLSQHEIANILGVSSSSINKYLKYFTSLNLEWPLSDEVIMAHLRTPSTAEFEVDFAVVHAELMRHKSMTLQLIYEEYVDHGFSCCRIRPNIIMKCLLLQIVFSYFVTMVCKYREIRFA